MSFELQLWHFSIVCGVILLGCVVTGFWAFARNRYNIHGICVCVGFLFCATGIITAFVHINQSQDEEREQRVSKMFKDTGDWKLLQDFFSKHYSDGDELAIRAFAEKYPDCPDEPLYLDAYNLLSRDLDNDGKSLFKELLGECVVVGWDRQN